MHKTITVFYFATIISVGMQVALALHVGGISFPHRVYPSALCISPIILWLFIKIIKLYNHTNRNVLRLTQGYQTNIAGKENNISK